MRRTRNVKVSKKFFVKGHFYGRGDPLAASGPREWTCSGQGFGTKTQWNHAQILSQNEYEDLVNKKEKICKSLQQSVLS